MNTIILVGIILITLGAVGLIWGGISYTSSRNAVDMGSMHVQIDQTSHIPLSPIAGAAAVAAGIILIFVGRRRQLARSY